MITALSVYFRYGGDGDYLARQARAERARKRRLAHSEPGAHGTLANGKAGIASDDFAPRTPDYLEWLADGPETARMLMAVA